MPPSNSARAVRWFQTARGVSLVVKLAALGVFAVLLLKFFSGGL
jgi:hypothetical protein